MAEDVDLRSAVQSVIQGDGLVTRCLVVVEVLQGEEYSFLPMWDGLLPWDCLGWIEHARRYMESYSSAEIAAATNETNREDED